MSVAEKTRHQRLGERGENSRALPVPAARNETNDKDCQREGRSRTGAGTDGNERAIVIARRSNRGGDLVEKPQPDASQWRMIRIVHAERQFLTLKHLRIAEQLAQFETTQHHVV